MAEPENDIGGINERLSGIETRLSDIVARLNDIAVHINHIESGALGIVFLEFRDGVAASPFEEFSNMNTNSFAVSAAI